MDTKGIIPAEKDLQRKVAPEPEDGEGAVMGFFEHIEELRTRLFRATLAIVVGLGLSFFFTSPVLEYMKDTYGGKLLITKPIDPIIVFFRVSLLVAAVIASPAITYQLFMFIMPGLTRKEKRGILLALPATTALFLFGVVFTWFILMPAYIGFLKGFETNVFQTLWTADEFFSFTTNVLFWHGAAFETPLIFYVLARMGLVTPGSMVKFWRHSVVGAAIVTAFIAPTFDPMTMIFIMILLVGLYFLSVGLVYVAVPGTWNSAGSKARWRTVGYWARLAMIALFVILVTSLIVPMVVGGIGMWALTHPACAAGGKPSDFGITNARDVEIPTRAGGTYKAYFIPGTNGATIIIPPTFSGDRGGMLPEGSILAKHGYNILLFDSRVCAGKGSISLGYNEVEDVRDVLDYLKQNPDGIKVDMNRIGLHGFSSAGATSIMAAARYPEIRALVAEGGYYDMEQYIGNGNGSQRSILENLLSFGAQLTYRFVTGQDISVLSPLDNIAKIPPRPIFLVYGTLEPSLPGARLELAAAKQALANADVELWEVPNSGHGGYLYVARDEWEKLVVGFFDRVMLK